MRSPISPVLLGLAILLSLTACGLMFLLPADSLVVDLIYQAF